MVAMVVVVVSVDVAIGVAVEEHSVQHSAVPIGAVEAQSGEINS